MPNVLGILSWLINVIIRVETPTKNADAAS